VRGRSCPLAQFGLESHSAGVMRHMIDSACHFLGSATALVRRLAAHELKRAPGPISRCESGVSFPATPADFCDILRRLRGRWGARLR